MSITPETRYAISEAIWLTWLIATAGILGAFVLRLRRKRDALSRVEVVSDQRSAFSRAASWSYKWGDALRLRAILILIVLGALGADKVLEWIPTRNLPPVIRPPDLAAVRAAAERLRLGRARTLKRGEETVVFWGHTPTGARSEGVVAATGEAAHQIFGPGAVPAAADLAISEGGGRAYTVAGGTKALFLYYDPAFSDRNIACVILEDGPHARKLVWVPGERLRGAAR